MDLSLIVSIIVFICAIVYGVVMYTQYTSLQSSLSSFQSQPINTTVAYIYLPIQTQAINTTIQFIGPVGSIFSYASSQSPPTNFLMCDGAQHQASAYPALAALLTTSVVNGITVFTTPNLCGRMIQGGTSNVLSAGGNSSVTLSPPNLAPHTHQVSVSNTDLSHQHNYHDAYFSNDNHSSGAAANLMGSKDPNTRAGGYLLFRDHSNETATFNGTNTLSNQGNTNLPSSIDQLWTFGTIATNSLLHTHSATPLNSVGLNAAGDIDPIPLTPPSIILNFIIRAI